MQKLIVMVGLPRSGKSTQAGVYRRVFGYPVVNKDSVRLALHGHRFIPEMESMVASLTEYMVKALFLAGHEVIILDECNVKQSSRDRWINPMWLTEFHLIRTDKETCLRRALKTADTEIAEVIERMAGEWDYPEWNPNDLTWSALDCG